MKNLIEIVRAPWAITPEMFCEVQCIYAKHVAGEKADIQAIEARLGKTLRNVREDLVVENGVAIISLEGVLAKRMNLFMSISGGTSTQIAANQVRAALADPAISAVVLDIDSPGGTVDGTQDLARVVFEGRSQKPIIGLASGIMASAAYWIGSAAHRVFISDRTTNVGSIGVVATHTDFSKREEMLGIKTTEITAGRYKRVASAHAPLSPEGRADLQASVDYLYSIFVDDVARHRGVAVDAVLEGMADGRVFIGEQAIAAGLVDGISTLRDVVAGGASGRFAAEAGQTGGAGARIMNPVVVAAQARDLRERLDKAGINISATEAVDRVMRGAL